VYLPANGWRHPLVGGMRQRHFDGTDSKPRKLLENAQTPTSRVHAVLAGVLTCYNSCYLECITPQYYEVLLHAQGDSQAHPS